MGRRRTSPCHDKAFPSFVFTVATIDDPYWCNLTTLLLPTAPASATMAPGSSINWPRSAVISTPSGTGIARAQKNSPNGAAPLPSPLPRPVPESPTSCRSRSAARSSFWLARWSIPTIVLASRRSVRADLGFARFRGRDTAARRASLPGARPFRRRHRPHAQFPGAPDAHRARAPRGAAARARKPCHPRGRARRHARHRVFRRQSRLVRFRAARKPLFVAWERSNAAADRIFVHWAFDIHHLEDRGRREIGFIPRPLKIPTQRLLADEGVSVHRLMERRLSTPKSVCPSPGFF